MEFELSVGAKGPQAVNVALIEFAPPKPAAVETIKDALYHVAQAERILRKLAEEGTNANG